MSATPWEHLRIGDTEREAALRALGDHMAAGRLSVDEYGDRSAHVATAKTRGDLAALFTDLPEPRPRFGQVAPPAAAPPPYLPPQYPPAYPPPPRPPARRLPDFVLPVVGVALLVVAVFVFRFFSPFLLIPLIFLFVHSRKRRWP